MEQGSLILYVTGGLLLAMGFAAHVVHAVLLADGRRVFAVFAARRERAYAGVVSGSFVDGQARSERTGTRPTSNIGICV